ncbi:hypothetical protein [Ascidiimonas aurantiaca]|uniref:hypothetical protein n=1 Tax=Ascidiimonas aurantiaca TaxID=1685432 RepID=UPI0030EC1182
MKKKKLNQLHLKKRTISNFSRYLTGGQLLDNDDNTTHTSIVCTWDCPSQVQCPTLYNCPTVGVGCETVQCPTRALDECYSTFAWIC